MPGVITARYSPFTFDEMLKPLALMQQEYNTVQEGLSALTDSSNQFSRYLEGTQAGERVKQYNAAIDEAVTDMARNGLRSTNRDTLLGLKRQYNNDIAKINQSAAQLDTLYKGVQAAQLKAQASGDTLFVANMPNVDDLMANPSAAPMMVSGAGLQKQGMQAAQSASVRNILNNTRAGQGVMKMYNKIVQGYGYNSAQAQKFLQDTSTIPELQQAIESISSMYNIDALGNDSARAKQFIMQGIMDGLTTQQKSTYMEDPEKKAELEAQVAYNKAYATAAGKAAGSGALDGTGTIGGIYSQNFVTTNGNSMAQIQSGIDSLRDKNGGFSAQVFGRQWGSVNPMKAYEEYRQMADKQARDSAMQAVGNEGQLSSDFWTKQTPESALDIVKKKYKVDRLLTPSEYNALKDLGYTSDNFFQKAGSLKDFSNNLNTQINDLAHSTAIYNINGREANKELTERILQNADLYGANNSDATLVQEFVKGKKKGNVSPEDIREDMEKGAQFTLGLNNQHGLVITSSIGGKQYVIAPELISEEARRALAALPSRIQQAKTAKATQLGRPLTKQEEQALESLAYQMQLRDIANSVGVDITQVKGQTSKDAE